MKIVIEYLILVWLSVFIKKYKENNNKIEKQNEIELLIIKELQKILKLKLKLEKSNDIDNKKFNYKFT